jgi:hypothetical protein
MVRDSTDRDGGTLVFATDGWRRFTSQLCHKDPQRAERLPMNARGIFSQ